MHKAGCGVGANETLDGMSDHDGEVDNLGRWRDPKDAVRRAVRLAMNVLTRRVS